jgi:hypothetical protein
MSWLRRGLFGGLVAAAVGCFVVVACSSSPPPGEGPEAGGDGGMDRHAVDAPSLDARDAHAADRDAGVPYLVNLRVTAAGDGGDASAPVLVPPFASDVYDYYVRCAAGTNALAVTMQASAGSSSLLVQPVISPSLPEQTLPVSVQPNQAIVAAATNGSATTEYWVRCLPPDMPPLLWTPHPEAGAPTPGYYLVGDWIPAKGVTGYALVLDRNGVPVWYTAVPPSLGAADVDEVVAGSVSFYPFVTTASGAFEIDELAPLATITISATGYTESMHELRVLPGGDYLVFSNPLVYGVDLTGLKVIGPDGGLEVLGPDSTIEDCAILELAASGHPVWVWYGTDHFDPAKDSTFPTLAFAGQTAPDGGEVIDPFHCNSIDVDPSNGNLLVSARNMDSVFYVDRPSGAVLWKMGGASYTKENAAHVAVASRFFRQHDARLLPGWSSSCSGGSGQISLFDDAYDTKNSARGVIFDVVVGAPDAGGDGGGEGGGGSCDGGAVDAAAGEAVVAWEYAGTVNSVLGGSFRVSEDGSRLVGWGRGGAPNLVFSEVSSSGADQLDFGFANGDCSYRAIKVPLSALDLGAMRATAGLN